MTDEKVAEEAIAQVAKDAASDVKAEAPVVETHLQSFGEWSKDEVEKAIAWLRSKL